MVVVQASDKVVLGGLRKTLVVAAGVLDASTEGSWRPWRMKTVMRGGGLGSNDRGKVAQERVDGAALAGVGAEGDGSRVSSPGDRADESVAPSR